MRELMKLEEEKFTFHYGRIQSGLSLWGYAPARYLHSIMVGFNRHNEHAFTFISEIYIPLWSDSIARADVRMKLPFTIYIPLWSDSIVRIEVPFSENEGIYIPLWSDSIQIFYERRKRLNNI